MTAEKSNRRLFKGLIALLVSELIIRADAHRNSTATAWSNKMRAREATLLTPFGRELKTVVFVSLTSGVCGSKRDDWRAGLPRYLANSLRHTELVMHVPRQNDLCRACKNDIRDSGDKQMFDCSTWHSLNRGRRADMVVVFGTGKRLLRKAVSTGSSRQDYPELQAALRKPWIRPNTVLVHIPMDGSYDRLANPMGFTRQVGPFIKPVLPETSRLLRRCAQNKDAGKLVYIANGNRGQVNFLRRADPEQLKNFTVHFFGELPLALKAAIEASAAERKIQVRVRGNVGHVALMHEICDAAGHIHFSQINSNPTSLYESLLAGTPLFLSSESNVPEQLRMQPFIQVAQMHPKIGSEFHDAFNKFLEKTRQDWTGVIQPWALQNSLPSAAYLGLCQELNICASDTTVDAGMVHRPRARVSLAHRFMSLESRSTGSRRSSARVRGLL